MSDWNAKAHDIFLKALECATPESRHDYVREACGQDAELLAEVESLLEADDSASSFLEDPSADLTIDRLIAERAGMTIGHYKLLEEIGEGGMGVVYLAEQTEPVERQVALKIIKPGMDTRQVIARFEVERQALAMMDHPSIAKVFDAGMTDTGRPYFVMELVNGIPITEFCDQRRLTAQERLELFIPVCQAVQHAHQKGIIHRDIKPSNILVAVYDGRPVPKVIDFGVAKATGGQLTDDSTLTNLGQVVGTIEYMSPEQAQRNQPDIDTRSDIYSLGVVLYELLAGVTPFDKQRLRSAAIDELLRIIREEEPPRPSVKLSSSDTLPSVAANRRTEPHHLHGLLRGDLDWIVMKAMEKDRQRRYATAAELGRDIQRHLTSEPLEARPPTARYRCHKFITRHKVAFAFWTLVAVALLVGAGLATWQAELASRARDRAVLAERLAQQRLEKVQLAQNAVREEAEKVKTEAAISAAVLQFINQDLLSAADPTWEPNRELKVRDVLDRAAARIQKRFEQQPLVEAAIRHVLGRSYKSLGLYDQAQTHLMRARELRSKALGTDNDLTLKTGRELVDLLVWRGAYTAAEQLAKDGLAAQKRDSGAARPDVLETMRLLAKCYRALGRINEAEQLVSEVLQEQRRTLGPEDPQTLKTTCDEAGCHLDQGRHQEAESLFAQLVEIWERKQGPDYPGTLTAKHGLAECYLAEGRVQDAEDLLSKVLDARRRVLGANHYDTLLTQTDLAQCLMRQNKVTEGQRLYSESLDIARRVLGDDHPITVATMADLGVCYSDQGANSKAEALLQEALVVQRKSLGNQHPATLTTMHNLAACYGNQGRFVEANDLYTEVLEIKRRTFGPEHPDTLASIHNLAACYADLGQFDQAAKLQGEVLEIVRRKLGAEHPQTLAAMSNLATTYLALHRAEEAIELISKVRATALTQWGENNPITLTSTNNLAMCYDALGRYQEAEKLYAKLLEQVRSALGPDHPSTLRTANNLASCYKKERRYAEAEQLLTQTHQDASRVLGAEHPMTLVMANNLAGCYVAQGRYADGAKLHTQTLEQRRRVLGAEHPSTKRSVQQLGECWALWARSLLHDRPLEETAVTRALDLARKSVELAPELWICWTALGEVQFERGDWKASIQALAKAVSLETKTVDAGTYFMLALAYRNLGQASEARANAEDYRKVCAEMLQRFGQTDRPTDGDLVAWACALVSDATKDWPKAIALAEKAVKSDPKSARYRNTLGAVLYRAGRFEEALTRLSEADDLIRQSSDALSPPPAYSWFFLAMAHHQLGHSTEAKKWLDKAVAWADKIVAESDQGTADLSLSRRLTFRLLREEATALLASAAAAVPRKPVPKADKQPGDKHKPPDDAKGG